MKKENGKKLILKYRKQQQQQTSYFSKIKY